MSFKCGGIVFIICAQLSAAVGFTEVVVKDRSQCLEIRAEAVSFSGQVSPAVFLRWSVEVIGEDPIQAPVVRLIVDGVTVKQGGSGFQRAEDDHAYEQGAVKFGFSWFSPAPQGSTVSIEVISQDHSECLTVANLGRLFATKPSEMDIQVASKVERVYQESKRTINDLGGQEHESNPSTEVFEEVLFEALAGTYETALSTGSVVVNTELFRNLLFLRRGQWTGSALGTRGTTDAWRSNKAYIDRASRELEKWTLLLEGVHERYLACSVLVGISIDYAQYQSNDLASQAIRITEESCAGFPVSNKMIEVAALASEDLVERNSYGWMTPIAQQETEPE